MWNEEARDSQQPFKKVVLLWDNLKELREEYQSLLEIYLDQQEGTNFSLMKTGFMYNQNDADMLDQKISFLIETLRKKAVDSGLNEESLLPLQEQRDKQIYDYIKISSQRPQSAVSNSTRPGSSIAKGTEVSMRSSFYSTSGQGQMSQTELNQDQKIVESFKMQNILELKQEEREILEEIKKTINEECEKLNLDIEEIQFKLLNKPPTAKELSAYSSKLEGEVLRSDQVLKMSSTPKKKQNLPKLGSIGSNQQLSHISGAKAMSSISQVNMAANNSFAKKLNIISNKEEQNQQQTKSIIPKKGPIKLQKSIIKPLDTSESLNNSIISTTKRPLNIISTQQSFTSEKGEEKKEKPIIPKSRIKQSNSTVREEVQDKQNQVSSLSVVTQKSLTSNQSSQKQEMYGLDIEFLKELDLGDMIAEFQTDKAKASVIEKDEIYNKDMAQLQEEFGQGKTHVSKLRGICKEYRKKV